MTTSPGTGFRDWQELAAVGPDAFAALGGLVAAAWRETDAAVLELARLRIATLLGNEAELAHRNEIARRAGLRRSQVDAVSRWPSSPEFGARERACLALAEQFVLDAGGVTAEQVAAVTEHLGPAGCYAFVEAVSVLETFQRACLTLGLGRIPTADELVAGVDASTRT